MAMRDIVNQVNFNRHHADLAAGRQAMDFALPHIHHKCQRRGLRRGGAQDTKAARFDHVFDGRRRSEHELPIHERNAGAIIGNQARATGHELQRQGGFS